MHVRTDYSKNHQFYSFASGKTKAKCIIPAKIVTIATFCHVFLHIVLPNLVIASVSHAHLVSSRFAKRLRANYAKRCAISSEPLSYLMLYLYFRNFKI